VSSDAARILVVEDDPDQRCALAEILRGEGYEASEAESAEGALDLLQHQPYDLIVTDYDLGGATGLWLAQIATRTASKAPRALLVTGHERIDEATDGLKVLRKPLDLPRFLAEVDQALRFEPEPIAQSLVPPQRIALTLYVSESLSSRRTLRELQTLLEQYEAPQIALTVVDLSKEPADQAEEQRVVVTPTLLKTFPPPQVWVAGELRDPDVVVALLDQASVEMKK